MSKTTVKVPTPPVASTPVVLDKPAEKTAAKPAVTAAAPKPAAKSGSKAGSTKTAAPAPATSRFAERFAPPRPPARGYPELMETVKIAHKADPKLVNAWKTKLGRDLTAPELLAMPEAEYMNDKQLEFFRARLQVLNSRVGQPRSIVADLRWVWLPSRSRSVMEPGRRRAAPHRALTRQRAPRRLLPAGRR